MIYLDNAATTPVCAEAIEAAVQAMREGFGNPSSTHKLGREAKKKLEEARKTVAGALGCAPETLYFTSCGSESDNWAILRGAEANARAGKHIISSAVEHAAVLKTLEELKSRGWDVTLLKPETDGSIAAERVLNALRPETALITLMTVNNETGGVTDLPAITAQVKKRNPNTLIHTDAVQAFLKVPVRAEKDGADLISISGHKIHAPKGIGALYIRKGLRLRPLICGGGQESGLRSGTESLPLICSFAAAAETGAKQFASDTERMKELKRHMAERLTAENDSLRVIESAAPQILSISLPGYRSEVLMNFLEAKEIYVSKSSACKKGGRSYVLEEIGMDAAGIDGAIRVGLSRLTTQEEADTFCDALRAARETLRHR